MKTFALTTKDNPFDPFEDFRNWYLFDIEKGYHCCELQAKIARTSNALSDAENNEQIERAIDTIIRLDFQNIYKKVEKTY